MINQKTGRVHTSYHQAVAATGRLSSSDPNLQNIPIRSEEGRRIREAFVAPEGRQIVALDYSQIELRIMAHLSEDDTLVNAFNHDLDIHRATAAEIFETKLDDVSNEQRRHAKAVNFGLIYGMSAFGLAKQLNVERKQAQTYIDQYFSQYPGVKEYMESTREFAREHGFVETVFGRRLYLDQTTKLPLRSVLLDHTGKPLAQTLFVDFQLQPNTQTEQPHPKTTQPALNRQAASHRWRFEPLPAGFDMMLHQYQKPADREHFIFSDGLSMVSVYLEPWSSDGMLGFSKQGATWILGARKYGRRATLLGEVPKVTLQRVADAIQPVQR